MQILSTPIKKSDLLGLSQNTFGDEMVKAVVDTKKEIIAIDSELHADLEQLLLENGSNQYDLWGINLYPEDDELIEFDSMINIRPAQNNRSRNVEDPEIRAKITEIVKKWLI